MDSTLIACLVGGIVLVLAVFFVAKLAIRWMVRLLIVALMMVLALGAAAWWWLNQPSRQIDNKPRQTNRRASEQR